MDGMMTKYLNDVERIIETTSGGVPALDEVERRLGRPVNDMERLTHLAASLLQDKERLHHYLENVRSRLCTLRGGQH